MFLLKKLKFLFIFMMLFSLTGLSIANSQEAIPSEKFIVGTTSGYAPYVSLNEKGEYEGFDIDMSNLIAQRLNKKIVIQDLGSMPSLLVALQKKKIDAIIWAMSITEDRKKEMEMIYYQGDQVTEMPFLFWKEIPKGISKIEDLEKYSKRAICLEAGSYQDAVLRNYPALNLRFLDKITDGIMELKYGKCLTTCVDNSLINRIQSQYPELKVLNLPLPKNQQSLGNGICLHKSNLKLITQVEKIIADLRTEGEIAELEKKWKLTN